MGSPHSPCPWRSDRAAHTWVGSRLRHVLGHGIGRGFNTVSANCFVLLPNIVHLPGRRAGWRFAQVGLREVRRWTYQSDPLLSSIRAMVIHGMAVRTATPICAAAASTVGRPGPLRIRSGASESAASPHQSTRTARLAAIRIGAVGVGNAPRSTTNATASCVPVNEASNHRCSTTVE